MTMVDALPHLVFAVGAAERCERGIEPGPHPIKFLARVVWPHHRLNIRLWPAFKPMHRPARPIQHTLPHGWIAPLGASTGSNSTHTARCAAFGGIAEGHVSAAG